MIKVAPSILSADFLRLGEELKAITQAGADFLHIDVMDGHYVPNITFGPLIVEAAKKATSLPLDVHLMIDNASCYADAFIDAGADFITVHQENNIHLERLIKHIKSRNKKVGVALNPATHEESLRYCIEHLDLILIMSVNPGFAAQSFLPGVLPKIAKVKTMLKECGNEKCLISVDGGISDKTAPLVIKAGANMVVAGSYIFKEKDYGKAIQSLKNA